MTHGTTIIIQEEKELKKMDNFKAIYKIFKVLENTIDLEAE